MSDPFTTIVLTASELKIAAMPQFNAFAQALVELEDRLKTDLVVASKDDVFTQQGKCQIVSQLRKKIEDCIKLREELKRRN